MVAARTCPRASVERPSAMGGPAQTGNLLILNGKLVVVSDFFIGSDVPLGVDDNFLLVAHGDNLGIAVRLQGIESRAIWHIPSSCMNDQTAPSPQHTTKCTMHLF